MFPSSPISARQPHWRFVHVLAIFALLFLLLGVGFAVLRLFLAQSNPDFLAGGSTGEFQMPPLTLTFTLAAAVLQALAFIVPIMVVGWRVRVDWATSLGWQAPQGEAWRWWGMTAVFAVLCPMLVGWVARATQWLMGHEEFYNPQAELFAHDGFSWGGMLAAAVVVGMLVPLAEELIFRGVLYRWLRVHWPAWATILTTAVLFAALHWEISVVAGILVMGLGCGWLVEKSGSIWPAIVVHVINNLLAVAALFFTML